MDAGFLYSAGSEAVTGIGHDRVDVQVDRPQMFEKLSELARARAGGAPLLRIYWYDGSIRSGLTEDQEAWASMDDVKLRLGVVNTWGQQKGVDSLIVLDLVELSRNRAISDAVLVSGDEDLRVGVQLAQSFGVRVHLVGVASGAPNRSNSLFQEADTVEEWTGEELSGVLAVNSDTAESGMVGSGSESRETVALDQAVDEVMATMQADVMDTIANLPIREMIPSEVDGAMLAIAGRSLEVELSRSHKHYLRSRLRQRVAQAVGDG